MMRFPAETTKSGAASLLFLFLSMLAVALGLAHGLLLSPRPGKTTTTTASSSSFSVVVLPISRLSPSMKAAAASGGGPDFSILEDDGSDDDGGDDRQPTEDSDRRRDFPRDNSVAASGNRRPRDSDYGYDSGKTSFRTVPRPPPRFQTRREPSEATKMAGTSWMQKNDRFSNSDDTGNDGGGDTGGYSRERRGGGNGGGSNPKYSDGRLKRSISDTKTFREDFRRTRVFVQGIPPGVSWQDLKDHFRVAGNVVFASISVDVNTGETKGHGIVQFETTAMAQRAVDVMRDHPLHGVTLFVREDVQESTNPDARLRPATPRGPTLPTKWKCANEENAVYMSDEELDGIRNLIKARDDARHRKKFDVSDRIREELKEAHGVFIDDRLKMWWTTVDGNKVPQSIHDIKGDGRWKLKPWRHIPTTPENDASLDPDLVEGLLRKRDVARREKDFKTADALLEEAQNSPDGDLTLRIHDESRTWRVWTENPPPMDRMDRDFAERNFAERRGGPAATAAPTDPDEARRVAAAECMAIVKEKAPEKAEEIVEVLKRFPGREFQVLKRLKQQYL